MQRVLVSACLLGQPVRYDGGTVVTEGGILARWPAVCPCHGCPQKSMARVAAQPYCKEWLAWSSITAMM